MEEDESHDWMEGARIGEAQNPGPARRRTPQYRTESHVLGKRDDTFRARDGRRGARAVPTPPAGEYAKGIRPGPNPTSDRTGNRPAGNDRGDRLSTAMRTNRPSRPGSAQGNQNRERREREDDDEWRVVRGQRMQALRDQITRMRRSIERLQSDLVALEEHAARRPSRGDNRQRRGRQDRSGERNGHREA